MQITECRLPVTSGLIRILQGLLLALGACAACQVSASPEVRWDASGFGTLGLVSQEGGHDWGFVRNSAQLGAGHRVSALPDSRAGLQLDVSAGEEWEGGVQAVVLRRPNGTPIGESLERAYVGYRPFTETRIRLGRTSPDTFLFADSRHVGFALPWARPPVDFYGFFPVAAIDGAEIEQRWASGDSTWRAKLTAGVMRTSVTDGVGDRLPMQGHGLKGLSLTREEDGLLLKFSYLSGRLRVSVGPEADQLRQALHDLSSLPVPSLTAPLEHLQENLWSGGSLSYMALGLQYETGPWTVIAEGSRLQVPKSPLSADRAYLSLGYRQGAVTWYGVASRVTPRQKAMAEPELTSLLTPVVGPEPAQQAQVVAGYATAAADNYRYHQRTVGAGVRWDFSPTAALKLQADRSTVYNNGGAGWRFSDAQAAKATVYSVVVDVVWGQ